MWIGLYFVRGSLHVFDSLTSHFLAAFHICIFCPFLDIYFCWTSQQFLDRYIFFARQLILYALVEISGISSSLLYGVVQYNRTSGISVSYMESLFLHDFYLNTNYYSSFCRIKKFISWTTYWTLFYNNVSHIHQHLLFIFISSFYYASTWIDAYCQQLEKVEYGSLHAKWYSNHKGICLFIF